MGVDGVDAGDRAGAEGAVGCPCEGRGPSREVVSIAMVLGCVRVCRERASGPVRI